MPSKFNRTKANAIIAKILFICKGILSFPGFGALLPYYYKSAIKKRSIILSAAENIYGISNLLSIGYLLTPFSDRIGA